MWVDTTVEELYAFFAIHISMGSKGTGELEDYWECNQDWPMYLSMAEAMSMERFEQLNKYLCPFDPDIDGHDHEKVWLNHFVVSPGT